MGLFTKFRENMAAKTAKRREFKLQKQMNRQTGRSERVRMRQDANVAKATIQGASDVSAYENGQTPVEHQSMGMQVLNGVGGIVGSVFGKGGQEQGGEEAQVQGNGFFSNDPNAQLTGGKSQNKLLLYGGIALAAILILPKIMKNGGRR